MAKEKTGALAVTINGRTCFRAFIVAVVFLILGGYLLEVRSALGVEVPKLDCGAADASPHSNIRKWIPAASRHAAAFPSAAHHIPKVILQVYSYDHLPKTVHERMSFLTQSNTDFDHELFSEDRMLEFVERYFAGSHEVRSAFEGAPTVEVRAMIFRLCFLFIKGGIYVDISLQGTASALLSDVLRGEHDLLLANNSAGIIFSKLVGASPKHPVIEKALFLAVKPSRTGGSEMSYRYGDAALTNSLMDFGAGVKPKILSWKTSGGCGGRSSVETSGGEQLFVQQNDLMASLPAKQILLPRATKSPELSQAYLPGQCHLQYAQRSSSLLVFTAQVARVNHRHASKIRRAANDSFRIPNVIVQTHKHEHLPRGMWEAMQSVIEANPDFDHVYFSDARAREFIEKHCSEALQAFDALLSAELRGELFGLCFLSVRGGVFVSLSTVAFGGLSDVIRHTDALVVAKSSAGPFSGFLAAEAKCQLVREFMRRRAAFQAHRGSIAALVEAITESDYARHDTMRILSYHFDDIGSGAVSFESGRTLFCAPFPSYQYEQLLHLAHHTPNGNQIRLGTTPHVDTHRWGRCLAEFNLSAPALRRNSTTAALSAFTRASSSQSIAQRIPMCIVQVHALDNVPILMWDNVRRMRELNSDFDHKYFSERRAREFIEHNFDTTTLAAYDSIVAGDMKSDLFRYCYLFVEGGVYVDVNYVPLMALSQIINATDELVVLEHPSYEKISNQLIAAVPWHPFLGHAVQLAVERIRTRASSEPSRLTGSELLYDALRAAYRHEEGTSTLRVLQDARLLHLLRSHALQNCGSSGIASVMNYLPDEEQGAKLFFTSYPQYHHDVRSYAKEWFSEIPVLYPDHCGPNLTYPARIVAEVQARTDARTLTLPSQIPRIIVQYGAFNPAPLAQWQFIQSIVSANSEFEHLFFTDQQAGEILSSHCNDSVAAAFQSAALRQEYRVALFCLCYLQTFGGVCLSSDESLRIPRLSSILDAASDEFVATVSLDGEVLFLFVASAPGNRFVSSALSSVNASHFAPRIAFAPDVLGQKVPGLHLFRESQSSNCGRRSFFDPNGGNNSIIWFEVVRKCRSPEKYVQTGSGTPVRRSPLLDSWHMHVPFDFNVTSVGSASSCLYQMASHDEMPEMRHVDFISVAAVHQRKSISNLSFRIPNVIVQTHKHEHLPRGMWEAMQSVIEANPDFDHVYFSDARAREFIEKHCSEALQAFDALLPGAMRARVFELCYLREKGGVYMDVSVRASFANAPSLSDVFGTMDELIAVGECESLGGGVMPFFLAAVPNHPIVETALSLSVGTIQRRQYTTDPELIIGALLLKDVFRNVRRINRTALRLLQYVRPLHCAVGTVVDAQNATLFSVNYPTYEAEAKKYLPGRVRTVDAWYNRDIFNDPPGPEDSRPICRFGMSWNWEKSLTAEDVTPVVVHMPSYIRARIPPKKPLLFPLTILHTHKYDHLLRGMRWAIQRSVEMNPDFDHVYFSDAAARDFIEANYDPRTLDAFDAIVPGAIKADLFRYLYLSIHGGVYIDGDLVAVGSLSDSFLETDEFVSVEDAGFGTVWNAFIASAPHHPIVEAAAKLALEHITKREYSNDVLAIAGPHMLGDVYKKIIGRSPQPHSNHAPGIRLFAWKRNFACMFGYVESKPDEKLFWSPYVTYRPELHIYTNTKKTYEDHWRDGMVFSPPQGPDFTFQEKGTKLLPNKTLDEE